MWDSFQADRTVLCDLLKTHNIERPNLPELPPEPKDIEPPPKTIDKLEVMSRNCDELKRTLAQLQGQMSVMTDKQKTELNAPGPSNKKTKNKKPKSKPEAKPTAAKPSVDTSAANEKAAAPVETAALAKSSEAIPNDKPLAELVTKVLAENPPPIELLESVLSSEVLADILNKEQNNGDQNEEEEGEEQQQIDDGAQQNAEEILNGSVNESADADGENEPDATDASNEASA